MIMMRKGTVFPSSFVVLLLFGNRSFTRRISQTATSGTKSLSGHHIDDGAEGKDLDLPLFDLGTIADATDNFSIHNKLGEGGYGPVYKVCMTFGFTVNPPPGWS